MLRPVERVTKAALLARIHAERSRFERVVAGVAPERLTEPVLPGGWSVKDVLAHVAWGEREAVGVLRHRALAGSGLWDLPEDERNAAVVAESRSRDVEDVRRDHRAAFRDYVTEIAALSDDDLNEPDRISGLAARIPGWRPWRVIYDPGHYDEHARAIEAAFGQLSGDQPPGQ